MNKPTFTIKQEDSPALGRRYVVYCGDRRIGSAGSQAGAEQVKREHQAAIKRNQKPAAK